jgi:hypothetical protein
VRADLQGQVRGERVHGHGDAAAGHPLVQARLRGPAQRVRRHQPRHPTRRLRQATQIRIPRSGSADPYLLLMDPDPAIFVIYLKDANKKLI